MALRLKLALIAGAVALIGAAALGTIRAPAPTPETLRIGAYEGDVGALAWIAEEQGFFKRSHLDVELKGYDTGKASVEALQAGAVDVATASEFVVADRSFAAPDLRILASVSQYWNKGLIARRDHGIAHAAGLRGKRIGVTFTSTAEYSLVVFLALHDLTRDDVELVDLPPRQLVEQLKDGAIDAAITWQPHVDAMERALADQAVQLLPHGSDAYLVTLTRASLTAPKAGAMERYLQALLLAEEWVRADPGRARDWLAKRFSLAPDYVARLWPDMKLAVTLPQEILEIMDGEARWLAKKSGRAAAPDFSHTLHAAPLAAAKPAAVTVFWR